MINKLRNQFFILILIFASGCSLFAQIEKTTEVPPDSNEKNIPTVVTTGEPATQPASAMTATKDLHSIQITSTITPKATNTSISNACNTKLITVYNSPIKSFEWSQDSRFIYFQSTSPITNYGYDLIQQKTMLSDLPNHSQISKVNLPPFLKNIPIDQISISPTSLKFVYYINNLPGIKATLNTTTENSGLFRDVVNTINFYDSSTQQIKKVGTIHGLIDSILWSPDEKIVLIIMNNPAAVAVNQALIWVFNVDTNLIKEFIPSKIASSNTLVQAISEDKSKVLFYDRNDKTLRVKDTITFKEDRLLINATRFLWWNSDSESFIYFRDNQTYNKGKLLVTSTIYTYDLKSMRSNQLSNVEINYKPFSLDAVKISPNHKYVAFIEDNTNDLKYMSLCFE